MYPNPVKNALNIKFDNIQNNVKIELSNILGQKINTKEYKNTEKINFTINQLTGIYLITIKADNNLNITKKIIKN